jgi:hypothetical protein
MKKVIKRKLFFNNGLSKNFFLWEITNERGVLYEIIEEFKGQRIARAMLRGIYRDRIKALTDFKRVITAESALARGSLTHNLVFS